MIPRKNELKQKVNTSVYVILEFLEKQTYFLYESPGTGL